jgi:Ni,Fe-hydrogenase III small subunit
VFEFLRAVLTERRQTSPFPHGSTPFPERFRGRPALSRAVDTETRSDIVCEAPTGSVRLGPRNLPVIDLGACLFSPEEAIEDGACRVRYTTEIDMSARARENLVTPTGDVGRLVALDAQMRRLLGRSLRLRSVVAGSCAGCEGELNALGNVVFDMARFGVQFVASPRHADGIVITGVVNQNMVRALERTYAAVPDPRVVIAVGACAASGGPFRGGEAVVGIPASIPVDLWIPGCPPHPLTVLDGLLRLLGRIDGP